MTAIAFGCPSAASRGPPSGAAAPSTSGREPEPTSSPLKSIGALSFSPSPMTTTPAMFTVPSISRMASTAAWSAASLSPRPTQRPAASAAASVTRTSSSARLRSGACCVSVVPLVFSVAATSADPKACPASADRRMPRLRPHLHALGRFDAHEVERARDHELRRPHEREPERLLGRVEHAVMVVEAMEVVGHADRVVRDRLRAAPLGRLARDRGKVGKPLDQIALLGLDTCRGGRDSGVAGVAEDPGDPGVRVLDVVDGVLLAPLCGQVDVDLHRLVGPPIHQVPPGSVDSHLVHE